MNSVGEKYKSPPFTILFKSKRRWEYTNCPHRMMPTFILEKRLEWFKSVSICVYMRQLARTSGSRLKYPQDCTLAYADTQRHTFPHLQREKVSQRALVGEEIERVAEWIRGKRGGREMTTVSKVWLPKKSLCRQGQQRAPERSGNTKNSERRWFIGATDSLVWALNQDKGQGLKWIPATYQIHINHWSWQWKSRYVLPFS